MCYIGKTTLLLLISWTVLMCTSAKLSAQQPKAKIKQYGVEEGLSSLFVWDVMPDLYGRLWVNVGNNVTRFNGQDFHNPALLDFPFSPIPRIYRDDLSQVWIQSMAGDLAWIDYEKRGLVFYPHNDAIRHLTVDNQVESMQIRSDKTLLIGNRGKGLFKVSPEGEIEELIGLSSGYHGFVLVEGEDSLPQVFGIFDSSRINTPFTVSYLDERYQLRFQFNIPDTSYSLRSDLIKRNDSVYLFSTGTSTLAEFTRNGLIKTKQYPVSVNGLLQDRNGGLWLGSAEDGVFYHPQGNAQDSNRQVYRKQASFCFPAVEDHEGGIWIASRSDGLLHITHPQYQSIDCREKGVNEFTNLGRVTTDGKRILFLDTENHLGAYSPETQSPIRYTRFDNQTAFPHPIEGLYYDVHFHQLWVSGQDGLFQIDADQGIWSKPVQGLPVKLQGAPWLKKANQDSCFLLITQNQYFVIRGQKLLFESPVMSTSISDVIHLSENEAWISCVDNLWHWKNGELQSLKEQFPNTYLDFAQLLYENGRLWIAPAGQPLVFVENDRLETITVRGVPIRNVRSLFVEGPNRIHAISMQGGLRIQISSTDTLPYTATLYSQDFDVVMPAGWTGTQLNGFYYIGTPSGLTRFPIHPHTSVARDPPIMLIKRLLINGVDTSLHKNFDLKYNQNFIEAEYAGLTFQQSLHLPVLYAYRMVGIDNKWTHTKKMDVRYTTLPPGKYSLQVKVRLSNTAFSKPQIMNFTIQPPFWQTWWFIALCILAGIILIGVLFFFWYRGKLNRSALEIDKLRAEQRALRAQMNPHFMYNALSSLQELVFQDNRVGAATNIAHFAELMRRILSHSTQESIPLSEEIETLELYLKLEALRFEDRLTYSLDVDPKINPESRFIPPLIIQPFVENALKHGIRSKKDSNGQLYIGFDKESDILRCIIRDNGVGRKAAAELQASKKPEHKSFGTQSVVHRIHLLNRHRKQKIELKITDLYDQNEEPYGTEVELLIPD